MADCRALAEEVASWGGSVVPARVNYADGGWHKGSIRGWPAKASRNPTRWPADWFSWQGNWHVALCPRTGGLVALDCDGPEAVDALRAGARGRPWWDPPPLAYTTPGHGGGLHAIWRWPADLPTFSRMVVTLPGGGQVDLRGEGTFLLLLGAPRPDLFEGAAYELVSRPGEGGPPPLPPDFVPWMESLGGMNRGDAPSLQVKQAPPERVAAIAAEQGGRISVDRHTTLFALASYLRVRAGTRTFETLATALWAEVEAHFQIEGEEDHWQQEVLRVARNASRYTRERDLLQLEAAEAALAALSGRRT